MFRINTFLHSSCILIILAVPISACSKKAGESLPSTRLPTTSPSVSSADPAKVAVANVLPQADKMVPSSQYHLLTSGNQLMLTYYALSSIPPDMEKVASNYSEEYRRSQDAFRKQDILRAITPKILADIESAKTRRYFIFETNANLDHFDMAKKSFRISNGMEDGTYHYFNDNSDYKLSFTNPVDFQSFVIEDEAKARRLESQISSYRNSFHAKFMIYAQASDESNTSVKAEIVSAQLLDDHNNELAAH